MINDNIVIIDASAFIHRAFHGFPRVLHEGTGQNIGAVSGFTNMLWGQVRRALNPFEGVRATHMVVVFDHASKNHRHAIYSEYKANRPPQDPELKNQFPLCRKAAKAFNIPILDIEGVEADDTIATVTAHCARVGMDVTILSSDKDLMQLVGPMVHMWDPIKRVRLGTEEVYEKFGVYPDEMIDFQALVGDSVDNIPGVPGIGGKTAAALISEWSTLDEVIANVDKIQVSKKRREAIEAHADDALLSRQLATLKSDVILPFDLDAMQLRKPDLTELMFFLKRMRFYGRWEDYSSWLQRYA